MTMENQEEILMLLERFTKSKQKDIPRELEDYLNFVARTGDTLYRWVLVKPLFREKLVNVITDFHHSTPSIADIPQCPNVDPFNFERMKRALLERLDSFNSAPFTVQRICELLTEPRKQYTRIDKFMRAVEKNILVVSTQEPGRRRSDSENGDSLDSIVNGDLEVNVDIEMDNEQFHLEADALLPDSSDPVSSLHSSLADSVGSSQRSGEVGSELNGGGGFMSTTDAGSQTIGKSGLNSDGHQSVIDTNENATDGDIAAPMLEASVESSSTTTHEPTGKEEENERAAPPKETPQNVDEAVNNTDTPPTAQTVREEEITAAPEGLDEAAAKEPHQEDSVKGAVEGEHEEKVEQIKSQPVPPEGAAGVDEKAGSTTAEVAQEDDDEPKAKMIKYDDDDAQVAASSVSSGTTSVIKADVHASDVVDEAPADDPLTNSKAVVDEVIKADGDRAATVESVVVPDAVEPEADGAIPSGEPAVGNNSDLKEHSKSDEAESVAATVPTSVAPEPTAEVVPQQKAGEPTEPTTSTTTQAALAEMEASSSCVEPTTSQVVEAADVAPTTSQELEMELATVAGLTSAPAPAAAAAASENVVVEEVDMAGEPGQPTEMAAEEDAKPDDNVMDIDESSVEMMDQ
ncbi:serine/threonine-protein phosphatase 4 regulatory subunit 2 [Anopheles stephensi]|uniref:serine/threonine-protein phosphatase 4 regulatory subunit 2 n=1 Tax=Anopheles stephensi TaxID=30069 RepID=UPI001658AC32|nr:serine/threonine-protein phosphatase 4 regulatory subunit 2 [Anopheles stephensi]